MFTKLVGYIQDLYIRVRSRWIQSRRPLPDETVYVHIMPSHKEAPTIETDEFVIQLEPAI
jgi:hypothetical protein